MSDISEELGRLADLRDRGVLTQEEFDQQKALLLNTPSAAAAPSVTAPDPVASPAPAAAPATAAAAPVTTEQWTKPRPPGYAPPAPGSKNAVFIIAGVGALIVLLLVVWAAGVFRSSRATMASTNSGTMFSNLSSPTTTATPLASSEAPAPVAPAGFDDTWLMGQWENVAAPSCAQWMRFGADHSLGDNASGSGTWSLAAGPGDGYTLSMNITGTGLREGPIVRDPGAGTITMGSAPNTITWRKTTC